MNVRQTNVAGVNAGEANIVGSTRQVDDVVALKVAQADVAGFDIPSRFSCWEMICL